MSDKFRLVTRSDFDGLVCAVLLKELDLIDDILFVHPKDMQDGKIAITSRDITTNLPYVSGAHLAFDHHASETLRNTGERANHLIDATAPSAARVVYRHYGGKATFPRISDEMMEAVDKADSAQYVRDEVLNPSGWTLLNYLMDSRTGLGRFRDFRISNYALMMDLIDYCRDHSIGQILELPDVRERVDLYQEHAVKAKEQIQRCATVHKNLVVLDLPITALRRLTVMLVVALALRTIVVAAVMAGPSHAGLEPARSVAAGLWSPDGVFVWMRLLFGIAGPLSLVWFIWKTVEIRSTQSATGILYVQLFLVMAGELLAKYLRMAAGIPL